MVYDQLLESRVLWSLRGSGIRIARFISLFLFPISFPYRLSDVENDG